MTASFLLLLEFTRRNALISGWTAPGPWLHLALAASVAAAGWIAGLATANAAARYLIGLPAASAAAWQFGRHSAKLAGARRRLLQWTAVAFGLYAVVAGAIVAPAPFWPASALNQEWILQQTAVPIQLVRAVLACWITYLLWSIWKRGLAQQITSERYASFVRSRLRWTSLVVGLILAGGWALTQYLGSSYEGRIETATRSNMSLLAGNVDRETASLDAMARTLAAAPSVAALLSRGAAQDAVQAQATLDAGRAAAGASLGCLANRSGSTIAWSGDGHRARGGAEQQAPACWTGRGGSGQGGQEFLAAAGGPNANYRASAPVRGTDGTVLGTAVLAKSLAALQSDLDQFHHPYFVVDADGKVLLTNRPELRGRALWTSSQGAAAGRNPPETERPLLDREPGPAAWSSVQGQRQFVSRRYADHGRWSLVVLMPASLIIANRFSGIFATLLASIVVIVLFSNQERSLRDRIELERKVELQDLARDLQVRASTDPLTGLYNRFKFDEALAFELARAGRNGTTLSLVLFDVDHFKQVNDTYGHPVGDAVLVELARHVAGLVRKSDVLARWGGEEFAVLSPGSDAQVACQAAERLRLAIEQKDFDKIGRLRCSFGVAQRSENDTAEALVAKADAALYRAKIEGRNRVAAAPARPAAPVPGADRRRPQEDDSMSAL
jgi:diguanylate cyclase (GGDEF)-like protein